eukprot:2566235-Rhodomonas_salina.1
MSCQKKQGKNTPTSRCYVDNKPAPHLVTDGLADLHVEGSKHAVARIVVPDLKRRHLVLTGPCSVSAHDAAQHSNSHTSQMPTHNRLDRYLGHVCKETVGGRST